MTKEERDNMIGELEIQNKKLQTRIVSLKNDVEEKQLEIYRLQSIEDKFDEKVKQEVAIQMKEVYNKYIEFVGSITKLIETVKGR